MEELEKLKEIFLSDVDSETYEENITQIREWEQELFERESFKSWQEHDTTRVIMEKAKKEYVDMAKLLATRRTLTEAERQSLWAKQDACLLILSWADGDPGSAIENLRDKVTFALGKV